MKNHIIAVVILLFLVQNIKAQETYHAEAATGWMFFNLIGNSDDFLGQYKGYGIQNDLTFWLNDNSTNRLNFKIGLGYTNFIPLEFSALQDATSSSYLGLKTGLDFTISDKIKLKTSLSTYVLLHKDFQDYNNLQRRFFTNLDIGLQQQISKNWSLFFSTPITLRYMYKSQKGAGYLGSSGLITTDANVELIGLNVGVNYKIGNNKKDFLPKLDLSRSESSISLEIGASYLFYDVLNHEEDVLNYYQGQAIQSNLNIWFNKSIHEKVDAKFGLGYTNYNHINYNVINASTSSYLNFRFGTDIQTGLQPLKLSFAVSNYLLLNKELQDSYKFQKRLFTNIDLGANINLTDRLSLSITTPLTIFPMIEGYRWGYYQDSEFIIINNTIVGTTGLSIGINYKLKSNK